MAESAVKSITIHSLEIPLRRRVAHAAAARNAADPIVVAVELIGGAVGHGETLPRTYVTGEDTDGAVGAIRDDLAPLLLDFRPDSFAEALEAIDALPWRTRATAPMPAARAAVELALLDAYSRHFNRPVHDAAGWLGLPGFGTPGSSRTVRYSGVLLADDVRATKRLLRRFWWFGIRHFKLKVGDRGERERLDAVVRYLRRPLESGRATLRLDANGAWTRETALERLGDWRELPIAAIEQPLAKGCEETLKLLGDIGEFPIYHDESLVSLDDARRLIELGVAGGFNIRLSKCGGLLPALRLAELARRNGVGVQLGCMVGETGILSAAGLRFLEMTPGVAFAEGCFGRFLLKDDIVEGPLRFGYGGRGPELGEAGWGVSVCADKLRAYAARPAMRIEL